MHRLARAQQHWLARQQQVAGWLAAAGWQRADALPPARLLCCSNDQRAQIISLRAIFLRRMTKVRLAALLFVLLRVAAGAVAPCLSAAVCQVHVECTLFPLGLACTHCLKLFLPAALGSLVHR